MSTIGVEATSGVAAAREFVDAPVLGLEPAAEQGVLTVLASGPLDRCARPVFDAVGQDDRSRPGGGSASA